MRNGRRPVGTGEAGRDAGGDGVVRCSGNKKGNQRL